MATTAAIGRMIVFSGLTVAVSLVALCIFPQRFLYSIGIGGALVALMSAAVCLLFLPALLALLGTKVNALAPPALQGPPVAGDGSHSPGSCSAIRVSVALVAIAVMVVAGLPILRVELTQANARILPRSASARQVDDAVAKRLCVKSGRSHSRRHAERADRPGRCTRNSGRSSDRDGRSRPVRVAHGVFRVDALLASIHTRTRPSTRCGTRGTEPWAKRALIAGAPAELVDQRHSLATHLPLALGFIVLSTVLILFLMTGSVVLPLIALVMNTLTVSVAFGVLVFIFQDGRFESTLDYMSQSALDTSMPILLFAVVFGLSTDYGVFLFQRIGEARRRTDTEDAAIADGLVSSGRVITAAALLFAVAMGAFVFSDLIYVKEVAVGAAVAVLVDATIVRAFLLPAILGLLGEAAWWSPRWLGRRQQAELS